MTRLSVLTECTIVGKKKSWAINQKLGTVLLLSPFVAHPLTRNSLRPGTSQRCRGSLGEAHSKNIAHLHRATHEGRHFAHGSCHVVRQVTNKVFESSASCPFWKTPFFAAKPYEDEAFLFSCFCISAIFFPIHVGPPQPWWLLFLLESICLTDCFLRYNRCPTGSKKRLTNMCPVPRALN